MAIHSVSYPLAPEEEQLLAALLDFAWGQSPFGPWVNRQWFAPSGPGDTNIEGIFADLPTNSFLDGYLEITLSRSSTLKLVIRPSDPDSESEFGRLLLNEALKQARRSRADTVRLWVRQPTSAHDKLASEFGLGFERNLFHMSRSLIDFHHDPLDLSFTTRGFLVGKDEAGWLAINNAAFSGHLEQGNWSLDKFTALEAEPWFSPQGLLVYEQANKIVAFCWTKIEPDNPSFGEIYVVGVDPSAHGRGLGKSITIAAMDYLAQVGCTAVDLYVDGANTTALTMYERLGFSALHHDRAYVADLGAL